MSNGVGPNGELILFGDFARDLKDGEVLEFGFDSVCTCPPCLMMLNAILKRYEGKRPVKIIIGERAEPGYRKRKK